jgi:hypothetical protein
MCRDGVGDLPRLACRRPLPPNEMIITPTTLVALLKVPHNGPHGAQPLDTQHHVVATEWNGEEIDDELLIVDEDVDVTTNPDAGDAVAIVNRHVEAWAEQGF